VRFYRGGRKLPWITVELSCLNNKKTKAAKRSKASEKRCLEDETIDDCECEQLRGEFFSLREEDQLMHGRTYDNYHVEIEEAIRIYLNTFFGYVDLKKKRVVYPSVMHFEGRLGSVPDEHMLMMYGCLLIPDQISCSMTHLLLRYRVFYWC
jgi:hypothetical protein